MDLHALCVRLLPRNTLGRIRYFTALVNRRTEPRAPVRQATYPRALACFPLISTHYGHFLTTVTRMPLARAVPGGPKTVEVIKTAENGSDVNLATYLLADAFRADAQVFVVVSNDSDLVEPIRLVRQDLRLAVGIVNPHPAPKRSRALLRCEPTKPAGW